MLGLAGGNVGDYSVRLKALLPFRRSIIVNDGIIAMHGALGAHDGVIAIVGTGSVFVSRRGNRIRSIGGWGFQVGDLGGGARLGRQLLEEVLLAHDGVRPASALTGRVMAMFDDDPRKIVDQVRDATPGLYGSFAPLLVEAGAAGDPVARGDPRGRLPGRRTHARRDRGARHRSPVPARRAGGDVFAARRQRYSAILKAPLGDALQGAVTMAASHADGD